MALCFVNICRNNSLGAHPGAFILWKFTISKLELFKTIAFTLADDSDKTRWHLIKWKTRREKWNSSRMRWTHVHFAKVSWKFISSVGQIAKSTTIYAQQKMWKCYFIVIKLNGSMNFSFESSFSAWIEIEIKESRCLTKICQTINGKLNFLSLCNFVFFSLSLLLGNHRNVLTIKWYKRQNIHVVCIISWIEKLVD